MGQLIIRMGICVFVGISTALIMKAIGAGEFSQGLWAGIFATICQHITGRSVRFKYKKFNNVSKDEIIKQAPARMNQSIVMRHSPNRTKP